MEKLRSRKITSLARKLLLAANELTTVSVIWDEGLFPKRKGMNGKKFSIEVYPKKRIVLLRVFKGSKERRFTIETSSPEGTAEHMEYMRRHHVRWKKRRTL